MTARHNLRLNSAAAYLLWLAVGAAGPALADALPAADAWTNLHRLYYGDRSIDIADQAAVVLETPGTTPDPAATPLTIRFGGDALGHIRQLRVFIDNNPSPVASTFDFAPGARIAEIGMRVRVDRMTSVRAVAETTDGTLEMRSAWVNAAGGCSAPPASGGSGALGEIRFRNTPDGKSLQVAIRHPNNSGFQIDPISGNPIPAHYVTHIRFSSGAQTLLDVDAGISLSENPTLRIASDAALPEPVRIDVTDSKEAHFDADWRGPAPGRETISDAAVGNR
jgi:sulfur-oxidizing protein SoxY